MKENLLLLKDSSKPQKKNIYIYIYKYKCMTAISKSVYIEKLDDIVNEYNNTYHKTTKKKPVM